MVGTDGGTYAILHHFSTNAVDGMNPYSGLVQDSNGVLYGTTVLGGTNYNGFSYGFGTIFSLNTNGGGFSLLHNFTTNVAPAAYRFPLGVVLGTERRIVRDGANQCCGRRGGVQDQHGRQQLYRAD